MFSKKHMAVIALILIIIFISGFVGAADMAARGVARSSSGSTSTSSSSSSSSSDGGSRSSSSSSSSGSDSSSSSSGSRSTSSSARSIAESSGSTISRDGSSSSKESEAEPTEEEARAARIKAREEKEKQENEEYVRARFEIQETVEVEEETVQRLVERRSEDYDNFKKIVELTTNLIDVEEDKEVFANELTNMDKGFVEKLTDNLGMENVGLKKHVNEYVDLVKTKKEVKVEIKEMQIEDLFNGETDIDSLIEQIWNS